MNSEFDILVDKKSKETVDEPNIINNGNYVFPLFLKSNIDVYKCDDFILRKITDDEVFDFFGVSQREISENGSVRRCNSNVNVGRFNYHANQFMMMLNNMDDILGSNYLFEMLADNNVGNINTTIKLFSSNSSGIMFGFCINTPSIYVSQNPFCNKLLPKCSLNIEDLPIFNDIFLIVKNCNDKTKLILEKYMYALSGDRSVRIENRFLELITVSEMLYVPDSDQGELRYKLAARAASLLHKYCGFDKLMIFNCLTYNYKIRSKIVHEGSSDKLTEEKFKEIVNILRESILIYLKDENLFESKEMDNKVLI